jgi:gliding motility-associated-like protein
LDKKASYFRTQVKEIMRTTLSALVWLCALAAAQAQCIVINEIMINGPGPNDGQNSPNTEEWIELYNTCSEPVDIGCYVLTDGDFGVTIPTGTVMPPYSYYTIGSSNAGFTVDLNVAECGCAGGSNVGVLTNGDEQIALFDANYTMIDALIWGDGQMPINYYQVAYAGCAGHNYSASNASLFENLPSGGGQGCVLYRSCDGSMIWLEGCLSSTPGASNGGSPNYEIAPFPNDLCAGDCLDLSLVDTSGVLSVEWLFSGSNSANSSSLTPSTCYDQPGIFDISLQIISSCGAQIIDLTAAVEVVEVLAQIDADPNASSCPGQPIALSTITLGSYQWYLDNTPLVGATNAQWDAVASGNYQLQVTSESCSTLSNVLSINYESAPELFISVVNDNIFCAGEVVELMSNVNNATAQWYVDGNAMAIGASIEVTSAGIFSFLLEENGCTFESADFMLSADPILTPAVMADELTPCPDQTVVLATNVIGLTVDWLRNNTLILSGPQTTLEINQSGTYAVEVTSAAGCVYTSAPVEIEYVDLPLPIIQSDDADFSFCENASITLTTEGAFDNFNWYAGNSLLGAGSQWEATEAGVYTVVGYANDCMVTSAPITIVVFTEPTIEIQPNGAIGTCVIPYDIGLTSNGQLSWSLNGTAIAMSNPPLLSTPGTYQVQALSTEGCLSDELQFDFNILEPGPISINLSDTLFCEGVEVQLTAQGDFNTWTWSTGEAGPTEIALTSGTYSVNGSQSNGCENTAYIQLNFLPLPPLQVVGAIESNCSTGALLEAESEGTITWWNNLNEMIASGTTAIVNPSISTSYLAQAELNGCKTEAWVEVLVDCQVLYIPNAFTPNADGINDVFSVELNGYSVYHLYIYDRWGVLVFESLDPNEVWTGGIDDYFAADGIYHYHLEYLDPQGQPLYGRTDHFGHITLLR